MNCTRSLIGAVLLTITTVSAGQVNTFDVAVTNNVSPQYPSTTVKIWAMFDPVYYAFWWTKFSFHASSPDGIFTDPEILVLDGWGSEGVVTPEGNAVVAIDFLQWHNYGGFLADPSNPLLLWQVTWTTSDFTPRRVLLDSVADLFAVYINDLGVGEDITHQFTDGHAEFFVDACYVDLDHNGALDLFDFLEFVNLFNADNPAADCDASGSFDLFDFLCFTNAFGAGC